MIYVPLPTTFYIIVGNASYNVRFGVIQDGEVISRQGNFIGRSIFGRNPNPCSSLTLKLDGSSPLGKSLSTTNGGLVFNHWMLLACRHSLWKQRLRIGSSVTTGLFWELLMVLPWDSTYCEHEYLPDGIMNYSGQTIHPLLLDPDNFANSRYTYQRRLPNYGHRSCDPYNSGIDHIPNPVSDSHCPDPLSRAGGRQN